MSPAPCIVERRPSVSAKALLAAWHVVPWPARRERACLASWSARRLCTRREGGRRPCSRLRRSPMEAIEHGGQVGGVAHPFAHPFPADATLRRPHWPDDGTSLTRRNSTSRTGPHGVGLIWATVRRRFEPRPGHRNAGRFFGPDPGRTRNHDPDQDEQLGAHQVGAFVHSALNTLFNDAEREGLVAWPAPTNGRELGVCHTRGPRSSSWSPA